MEQPSFNDTNSSNLRNIADTSDKVIRGLKSIDTKAEPRDIASSKGSSIDSSHYNTTPLTFSETKTAEETIIRWVQGIYFQEEIQSIKKQISLPPKSTLRSLHPFIDEYGLVRVGGRLQNSQLRFNSKHPIILPSQHSISELLIKEHSPIGS
ncbi:integrase catalytic domain-containing protein [Trichonephila clavipes]|nr:integrase catalytic domain-containing protein [Trichonephila clavipes]